jgi:hypothetical protein
MRSVPRASQSCSIALEISRIRSEVFVRAKLRGIDKDAHDDKVAVLSSNIYESEMPLVEIPHRGHKTDAVALGAGVRERRARLCNRARDEHT